MLGKLFLVMNPESYISELISDLLLTETDAGDCVSSVRSYEEAGVLTADTGLVIRMTDGMEFQVTIKRSK